MEDIEIIIEENITNIIVEVNTDQGSATLLRSDLGDFTADLTLNYEIAKL